MLFSVIYFGYITLFRVGIFVMNNIYRDAIENSECAFAYYEAVFDDDGSMVDYVFLDVNKAFEEITALKKENIVG